MKNDLRERLKKYGLGASALIAGSSASAQMIYTDIIPDDTVMGGEVHLLDLDNNSTVDFNMVNYSSSYSGSSVFASYHAIGVLGQSSNRIMNDSSYYAYALNNGDAINGAAAYWGTNALMYYKAYYNFGSFTITSTMGNWGGAADKYVGLQLVVGGNIHYGWARVSMLGDDAFIIKDYAYQATANVPTTAGNTSATIPAQANPATNVTGTDVDDNANGSDLMVSFNMAVDEFEIAEYRILVVKAADASSFTMADAQAVPSPFRTDVAPTGSNITETLTALSTDVDGDLLEEDAPYRVFVLSVADGVDAFADSLSVMSNEVTLTSGGGDTADVASNIVASDITDNGNGTDMEVTFTKAVDESEVAVYRVIVAKAASAPFVDLAQAQSLAANQYMAVTPTGSDITTTLTASLRDTDGDLVVEDQPYRVFVHSVADGVDATIDALSAMSNEVTLEGPAGIGTIDGADALVVAQNGTTLTLTHRSADAIVQARLYNLGGQLQKTQSNHSNTATLSVEGCASGVYVVEALVGDRVIRKRVFVSAF